MTISNTALTLGTATSTGIGILKTNAAGQDAATGGSQSSGDTVTISDEAKEKAGQLNLYTTSKKAKTSSSSKSSESSTSTSDAQSQIDTIKKQIKDLQQKIQKIQKDATLSEKEKQMQVQDLQNQLMQMNEQLSKLQTQSSGSTVKGGTPAQGFANSLT